MFKWNFLTFNLYTLSLVMSLGTTEKLGSVSFVAGYLVFMDIVKIPLSLLQSKESQNH